MKNNIKDTASCVILSKGLFFKSEGPELISNLIKDGLNINNIAVCSGANIGNYLYQLCNINIILISISINSISYSLSISFYKQMM